jgi:glycerol-3-phosphate dehydrogenase
MSLNRTEMLTQLTNTTEWDIIIIGGGATGLGAAVDSASRGYKTLLLEKVDFAKGTSSRSTKLVHGGVRYLKQGNISLVNEALSERGRLRKNAPHLVRNLAFVVPNYDWWSGPFYGIGLKLYDFLAGKMGLGPSRRLSKEEALEALPNLNAHDLRGGVIYYDGQFDDARLAIHLAMTAADHGASLLNYCEVYNFIKEDGLVVGVKATNLETETDYHIRGKVVINATGVFVDELRRKDDADADSVVRVSQGVHIVLPRHFLDSDTAIMVPETDDGRVLFAIPWYDKVVVGTTDTALLEASIEPKALHEELTFILTHAQKYLSSPPQASDVLSCFAGLRPLVSQSKNKKTSTISREHTIMTSDSGLLTITGGKWTTYRKMAEDVIDHAIGIGNLTERVCKTHALHLHGWVEDTSDHVIDFQSVYGADQVYLNELLEQQPELAQKIHSELPYRKVDMLWAIRSEMARTVDDLLARRTRSLLLNAKASIESAPQLAQLLAKELNKDEVWVADQVKSFTELAQHYIWPSDLQISPKMNDINIEFSSDSDSDSDSVAN